MSKAKRIAPVRSLTLPSYRLKILRDVSGSFPIPIIDNLPLDGNAPYSFTLKHTRRWPSDYVSELIQERMDAGDDVSKLCEIITLDSRLFIAMIVCNFISETLLKAAEVENHPVNGLLLRVRGVVVKLPNNTERTLTVALARPDTISLTSHAIGIQNEVILCDAQGNPLKPRKRFANLTLIHR